MTEQKYRVVADRDKGDDPRWSNIQTGDRYTAIARDLEMRSDDDQVVRIERPVPTTDVSSITAVSDITDSSDPSVPTREQSHTPTVAEFRAEYAALVSRLGHLDDTPGQTTRAWLDEFDRMVAVHLSVPTREQIAEAVTDLRKRADDMDSKGHHWSGQPAHDFFEAAAALRDAVALIQKGTDRG